MRRKGGHHGGVERGGVGCSAERKGEGGRGGGGGGERGRLERTDG
jgi:hypothetical protein